MDVGDFLLGCVVVIFATVIIDFFGSKILTTYV